jgi:hypothetical protein
MTTDMTEVSVASEKTAAFFGKEIVKPFARLQISRFATVLTKVGSNIMQTHPTLIAAFLSALSAHPRPHSCPRIPSRA